MGLQFERGKVTSVDSLTTAIWLERETFQIEHNPNCPSPYKVRLVQYGRGKIDGTEADAIGCGKTLLEAAEKARIQRDAVKAIAAARRAGVTIPSVVSESV